MAKRSGRPSAAQTPAPKSDKIVGSNTNKPNSATLKGASSIKLSAKTVSFLKKKLEEFNKKYPNKDNVSLNDLKAVYRRGSGAFSTSHRPNMNRAGWAYARTNKFLEKAAGKKVKAAYVQDDDLLKYEDGGKVGEEITCSNCGWEWNTADSKGKDKYTCHKCGKINKMQKYNPKDFKKGVKERQPRDLRKLKNFYSANRGAEWLTLRDDHDDYDKEDVIKADRWYDLMHKNQKIKKLTKKEFEEFKELTIFCASHEQSLEYAEGGEINYMQKYKSKDFKKGVKEELSEHKKTFQDLRNDKVTVNEAAKSVVAEHLKKKPDYYEKYKGGAYLKKGGQLNPDDKSTKDFYAHKSGNAGGMLVGKRHSEGGIKAVNKSTGQPLEMEGGETVITRNAVSDNTKREFEGEMLTNRQILSKINVSGGGVSFAEGGNVPYKCACSGKKYKYGGKLLPDYNIVDMLGGQHEYFDNLLPSEAFNKMFDFTPKFEEGGTIYEDGGMIRLVSKKVPSLQEYISKNFGISKGLEKKTYKNYLFSTYSIVFDKLPTMVKNGLLMGNQKLVDKYING
jgi:hypothetical protein